MDARTVVFERIFFPLYLNCGKYLSIIFDAICWRKLQQGQPSAIFYRMTALNFLLKILKNPFALNNFKTES